MPKIKTRTFKCPPPSYGTKYVQNSFIIRKPSKTASVPFVVLAYWLVTLCEIVYTRKGAGMMGTE